VEVPELSEVVDANSARASTTPSSEEVRHLVDMLVERRLKALKPTLTEQVMQELKRLYPSLNKD
jgi:hypothetical protein